MIFGSWLNIQEGVSVLGFDQFEAGDLTFSVNMLVIQEV